MRVFLATCLVWLTATWGALADAALERRLDEIAARDLPVVQGEPIAAPALIGDLYAERGFAPAWTTPELVAQLLAAIESSIDDGLEPADFHVDTVRRLAAADDLPAADREIVLSDALARLLYQLYFGKVEPRRIEPNWNFSRPALDGNDLATVNAALDAGDIDGLVARTRLGHPDYLGLREGLARYRAIAAAGGWSALPPGPTLKPGMVDVAVPILRHRLEASGDLVEPPEGAADLGYLYDPLLERAVRHFQARHGLAVDGLVGPATRTALNLPVEQRIDQIRVNLERARWVLRQQPREVVDVDIAGFSVAHLADGVTTWQSRVIVGQPYRQTPVFSDSIEYIVFNPTWTVPRSILVKDILPRIRRNPAYLAEQSFDVIDGQGRHVSLETATQAALRDEAFPWTLVQQPGPSNALGRMKFMFPNPFAVYLHDTPQRDLFERTARTFSSGCIRVDDAMGLAERLLADKPGWDREAIARAIASGVTRTVFLERQMPVRLLYRTATAESGGTVQFRDDIYDRDRRVLAALDEPFRQIFHRPPAVAPVPAIGEQAARD